MLPTVEDETLYCIVLSEFSRSYIQKPTFNLIRLNEKKRKARCKTNGVAFHPKYFNYIEGGLHVLMVAAPYSQDVSKADKSERNKQSKLIERENRCRNPKNGQMCRGKCTQCPRYGELNGVRENCCLRKTCIADCANCPYPRSPSVHLSLEQLYEDGDFEIADEESNFTQVMADEEFHALCLDALRVAINTLSDLEHELINALYGFNNTPVMSARRFAEIKGVNHTQINRMNKALLDRLNKIIKKSVPF